MLDRLKEYKELIAILVFFLGGFFWLQSEFPSKGELRAEIGSLDCVLQSYMKLTQSQISSQEQEKQVSELMRKLSEAPPDDASRSGLSVSPAMRVEFEQLKADYTAKRQQLADTTKEMAQIRKDLEMNICGKPKS
jgi:hypothetical protein